MPFRITREAIARRGKVRAQETEIEREGEKDRKGKEGEREKERETKKGRGSRCCIVLLFVYFL